MANTKSTDHVDSVTHDYIHDKCQNMAHTVAFAGLDLFMKNGQVIFHGGSDSQYPYVSSKINANYYTKMYDGTIQAIAAPVSTDLTDAAHQEGWGYWSEHESINHEEQTANGGSWAKGETVIPLVKVKVDAFLNEIGYMYDQNIANGDALNNTIIGMVKLMDITNANYMGWAFNGADAALRPANTTIAVSYTSLTMADLFEAYGDIEDKGRKAQKIVLHPDVLKRLRTLTENTVDRPQGGNAEIGHLKFAVLGAEVIPWKAMPTTTSTRIDFLNFNNHESRGVKGDSAPHQAEGNNFILEFGHPGPLGFINTGWKDLTEIGHPGVKRIYAWGSFKMMCTKPMDQAYISIA